MRCSRCQHENPPPARFCMACGAGLGVRTKRRKAEAVPRGRRKPPKSEAPQVEDLEKRLAEALQREAEASKREAEAREQQIATSEILRVISWFPNDVQPVFDSIAASALRLCDAKLCTTFTFDGELIHLVASRHVSLEGAAAYRDAYPARPGRQGGTHRAILTRAVVHIRDIRYDPEYELQALARANDFGCVLAVPMLRDGHPVGAITVGREAGRPFSTEQIELLKTFADQAVIAIENVRLFTELQENNKALTHAHAQVTESLEQQTATSDILKVISSSPTDTQPVFEAIAENAAQLCSVDDVFIVLVAGDALRAVAATGQLTGLIRDYNARRVPVGRTSVAGRAIVDRTTLHIDDLAAVPEDELPDGRALQRMFNHRTILATPLLREGAALGAIVVFRLEVRPFSERQQELLQTFADQAVIAIENVRLFTELQASNRELRTALDQQTATSEVLKVISRSAFDLEPVLSSLIENAVRLCGADRGFIHRQDGEFYPVAASYGHSPEWIEVVKKHPIRLDRGSATGRAVVERRAVHIHDVLADPEYRWAEDPRGEERMHRTILAVPMLREGAVVGVITIRRTRVEPFTDKQIELVTTFADQAVIAIENVRLFTELQQKNEALTLAHGRVTEALDQQTATSEILRVISSSPTDVQPVLNAIAEHSLRLCGGLFSSVYRFDGELIHMDAHFNYPASALERSKAFFPTLPHRRLFTARAILERRVVHVPDVRQDEEFIGGELVEEAGFRAVLSVPMLRDGAPMGAITVWHAEIGAFTEKQITLLQTFADQAVIAIENVRLFKELQTSNRDLTTALDQQTATSDILRVISRSQTELQPVFDAIVDSAARLCHADIAGLFRLEDGQLNEISSRSRLDPSFQERMRRVFPRPLDDSTHMGRALLERRLIHVADLADPSAPPSAAQLQAFGFRAHLAVPMLRGGEPIGGLSMLRRTAGLFSDDQVQLLQTFADQAVIAIENARLLTALQARTQELTSSVEQLTALGDVSRAVSSSLDLDTVLTTIVERAVQLSGTDGGTIFEYDESGEEFSARATLNADASQSALLRTTRLRRGEGAVGQMAVTREPFQISDIAAEGAYESRIRGAMLASGTHSVLAIPLLHEDRLVGGLVVTRRAPGAFTNEVVELLKTFATQSALAIQNARLFRELEVKSRELEAASQHKSEFLANMSHELRTPLNAIIGFSEVLSERMFGELNEKQDEYTKDIHASGQHLLSLINDILDLSKIEAGKMELELSDFDLPMAIDNALMLVRERAARRSIALHTTVDKRLGQVQGDERKIRQVLLNLLSNAIKFTPEGGRIEVGAKPVNGLIEVSVTDTGVGIALEDQEAVFEEFRQVGTADKKVEGTGLGLALSRKFIELHGGKIWVESQVGEGSTFTFTLPVRRGE